MNLSKIENKNGVLQPLIRTIRSPENIAYVLQRTARGTTIGANPNDDN